MGRMFSIRDLVDITQKSDKTLKKKLENLVPVPGPKGAKLYDSAEALAVIYQSVGDLSTERAKLTVLQQEKTQIEIGRLRGELISFPQILELVGRQFSAVRARLLAMPTALAKPLSMETDPAVVKTLLKDWIVDALTELTADTPNGTKQGTAPAQEDAGDASPAANTEPSSMGGQLPLFESGGVVDTGEMED